MSLKTDLVDAVCDMLAEGEVEFRMDELLRRVYPTTPLTSGFQRDARRLIHRIIKTAKERTGKELIPLTRHYFRHYEGGKTPDTEREAKNCFTGGGLGEGAFGFRLAGKDTITAAFLGHRRHSSVRHTEEEFARVRGTCAQAGVQQPYTSLQFGFPNLLGNSQAPSKTNGEA